MPVDPARVEAIFGEALTKADAAARAAYLDQACGGDAPLARTGRGLAGSARRHGQLPQAAPGRFRDRSCRGAEPGPGLQNRSLQALGADRRGGLRRGLHGRADRARAAQGGREDHQAGHGHAAR